MGQKKKFCRKKFQIANFDRVWPPKMGFTAVFVRKIFFDPPLTAGPPPRAENPKSNFLSVFGLPGRFWPRPPARPTPTRVTPQGQKKKKKFFAQFRSGTMFLEFFGCVLGFPVGFGGRNKNFWKTARPTTGPQSIFRCNPRKFVWCVSNQPRIDRSSRKMRWKACHTSFSGSIKDAATNATRKR